MIKKIVCGSALFAAFLVTDLAAQGRKKKIFGLEYVTQEQCVRWATYFLNGGKKQLELLLQEKGIDVAVTKEELLKVADKLFESEYNRITLCLDMYLKLEEPIPDEMKKIMVATARSILERVLEKGSEYSEINFERIQICDAITALERLGEPLPKKKITDYIRGRIEFDIELCAYLSNKTGLELSKKDRERFFEATMHKEGNLLWAIERFRKLEIGFPDKHAMARIAFSYLSLNTPLNVIAAQFDSAGLQLPKRGLKEYKGMLIDSCGRFNDLMLIESLLNEPLKRIEIQSYACVCLQSPKRFDDGLSGLKLLIERYPNQSLHNSIADAVLKAVPDPAYPYEAVKEGLRLIGYEPRLLAYKFKKRIAACLKQRDYRRGFIVASDIFSRNELEALAWNCARKVETSEDAERLAKQLMHRKIDKEFSNLIAEILCEKGYVRAAEKIFYFTGNDGLFAIRRYLQGKER